MVRLAVSSMFFHEYMLDEIFDFVGEAGLDTMEFWVETPHFWLREQPLPELLECISRRPSMAPLNVHAPILDLNPCSINPKVAAASVEYTLASVALAGRIGAGVVTVHPGRRTAKRPPGGPDFRRFDHYLSLLGNQSRKYPGVKVAIENMEKKVNSLLCTPGMVREVLDREQWLFFTLDTSHAMGVSLEEVGAYIELCGDRLVNVHFGRANGHTMHLPVESPEMAGILASLRDSGYRGPLTFEIEDRNFDHDLSSEEKVLLLARQAAFVRDSLG